MSDTILLHQPSAWDAFSTTYEAVAEPVTSRFGSALAKRLHIRQGERVIDVAAGSGALTLELARSGAQVTAIDHSPSMVARVAARAEESGVGDRVEARAMDGQALDLPGCSFDAGLSVFGIFLFPDHEAGLAELVRVLRPGGRAGISAWADPQGAAPALLLSRAARALWPDRPLPFRSPGLEAWSDAHRLERSMVQAGLAQVEVTRMRVDWLFPSVRWVADNAERLFGMMPIWSSAGAAERSHLLSGMLAELDGMETLSMPSPAWLATGIKPS